MWRRSSRQPYSGKPYSGGSLTRIGAFLIVVSLLASTLAAWELHAAANEDARASAHTIGVLVSEQTQDALQAVDLSMRDIQRTIASTSVATPARLRQMFGTSEFHDVLSHRIATLPQVDAITIVGADGKIVSSSRSWPSPEIDLSDRDYYTYFWANNGNDNYVSEAARNRVTNERMIFLAQRLNGPNGAFLGLIAAEIPLRYFENLYSRIGLSEGAGLTLLRRDGLVLVQYPRPDGADTVRMPEASPWYRAVQAGSGAYRSPGFLGTGKRFISVHPVTTYPVVVDATIAETVAFAHWRRQAIYIGLGALCAVLCILLLFRTLVTQFRRLERQTIDLSQTEARLMSKSRMLESTLEHMDQGLIMVNAGGDIAVYNRRAVEMFDLPPELMATHPPFADAEAYVRDNEQNAVVNADIRELIRVAKTHNRPCTYDRHGVDGRDIEVRSVPVTGGGFVRTYTDVTERKAAEERVRYLAHHDGLTRLANRVVLREHLERELGRCRRDEIWAVLCVDLDQFKNVNDTLGHPTGDLLLRAVAERLRGCVREGEIVARLGGDEFAIVQAGTDQPAHASLLAERIIEVLGKPFDIDGHEVTIGASVGIAVSGADGGDADTLLKHADMALYRAKADGRGVYRFF
jgi:diguanylate cyclase (GGDEF)-like protein